MGMRYWRLEFDGIGFNYRMTDMQAAVGLVQLRKLDALNERRSRLPARTQLVSRVSRACNCSSPSRIAGTCTTSLEC